MRVFGGEHHRRMAELAPGNLLLLLRVTQSYLLSLTQQPESLGRGPGTRSAPNLSFLVIGSQLLQKHPGPILNREQRKTLQLDVPPRIWEVTWLPLQW